MMQRKILTRDPIQKILSTGLEMEKNTPKKFRLEVFDGESWLTLSHYRGLSKVKVNFLYYLSQLMAAKMGKDIEYTVRIIEDES